MVIKSISSIGRNCDGPISVWGEPDVETLEVTLYKPQLGLEFNIEIDPNEYNYIEDLTCNPEEYNEKLIDRFEQALVEYIKNDLEDK